MLTLEELREELIRIEAGLVPAIAEGMEPLVGAVEAEAKKNCTLGESMYDWMWFPSKGGAPGAPYSVDKNPHRELVHMRDEMFSMVVVDGKRIEGIIGNTKGYALPVHDGTSVMQARPFILDSIFTKRGDTRDGLQELLSEYIEEVTS